MKTNTMKGHHTQQKIPEVVKLRELADENTKRNKIIIHRVKY
jgi:hypothetical protein